MSVWIAYAEYINLMALPHISFHPSYPFLHIFKSSPFLDYKFIIVSSFPNDFKELLSQHFSYIRTSVHSEWSCYCLFFSLIIAIIVS
jgi:hypothetical protein